MTIRKYIPDCITSMNLVCGIIGVIFAFHADFTIAFYLMLVAAVFDFMDGMVARALNSYSELGKQLDSLSDLVSFGVLPAVMLYSLMETCMFGEYWQCYIPLAIALFSGLRLAKFNIDGSQSDSFKGLPTPACAILCGSLCYYIAYCPSSVFALWASAPVFIPVLSIVLCALLVCRVPMFSFKFHSRDSKVLKVKRWTFLAVCILVFVACILLRQNWSLGVLIAIVFYIAKNLVYSIAKI